MKQLTLIGLLLVLVSGCDTQRTNLKTFYAFRQQVANRFSGTCDCGPIHRDPIDGWLFDVQPRQQREFSIRVWKCPLLTQEEWNRNYDSTTNRPSGTVMPTQTREEVAREAAAARWSLPIGSYENIGVDVSLQWPEVVTVEMEKDREEVVRYMNQIEQLLKLYHRPNNALEPTATAPSASSDK